jgi:predicted signal transduction protein with EAL and GGDEF domain
VRAVARLGEALGMSTMSIGFQSRPTKSTGTRRTWSRVLCRLTLSYLQSFPFDKIKFDRSFIKDIAESTGSLNIVRAVAALAQGLGITATAEGVETEEQLERIRAKGCKERQGFLVGAPMPAEDIERVFLASRRRNEKRGY